MSSCETSAWGPSGFCGPHGNCTAGVCLCEPGWIADRSFFKVNNCWQPEHAMTVVQIVVGVFSLLIGLVGLFFVFKLKTEARVFASMSSLTMFLNAGYMLAHHLEGNEHGFASVILCVLTIAGLSNAYAIALYVLLKPVWRFAGGNPSTLKKSFAIVQIGEFTAFVACAIAMLVFVAQKDDVQFSIAIAVFVCVLSIHFATLLILIAFPTWEVVRGMTTNSSDAAGRTNDKETKRLIKKIVRFIKMSVLVGPAIIGITCTFALIQFIMGSTPLIWVFYFIIILQVPMLGVVQLQLARPKDLRIGVAKKPSQQGTTTSSTGGPRPDNNSSFVTSGQKDALVATATPE